ncbi:hypothetical protein SteCoe_14749 [Stentor coeruleus]|uniref:RING-type domain-containing protein n=1 Tax=Stentor coeruleus TaxID=5963 RepID=A0A1R2C5H8_9CILI|nr:hypothetical protein SteCoe_14749 [Stentor coeruleus]
MHMRNDEILECAACKSQSSDKVKLKRLCQDHILCVKCIRSENCRIKLQCNFCNHAISRLCFQCMLPYHFPLTQNISHPIHTYCKFCIKCFDNNLCKVCKPDFSNKGNHRRVSECYFCRDQNFESSIMICNNHGLCINCLNYFSKLPMEDLHIVDCKFCEDALKLNFSNKSNSSFVKGLEDKKLSNEEKKSIAMNPQPPFNNPKKNTFAANASEKMNTSFLKPESSNQNKNVPLESENVLNSNLSPSNIKNQQSAFDEYPNFVSNPNELSQNISGNYKSVESYYEHSSHNNLNTSNYIQEHNYLSVSQNYPNNLNQSYDYNFYGSEHSYIQNPETSTKNSQFSYNSALSSQVYKISTFSKCGKHNTDCIFFEDCHHYQCYFCISEGFEQKFNKFLNSLNSRNLNWLNKSHNSLGCKIKNCFNKLCVPFDYVKHIAENICSSNNYPQQIASHYQLFFEGIKTTFFICPSCTYTSGYYFQKKCLYCNT